MNTNDCPSSTISGYQYNNHYDCVLSGYKLAHNTFINLKELEELEKAYIEEKKIVVKFECKALQVEDT
tara:strand:- start:1616 stop:1819 length:204 start_codon:yes stop_codon:yes gene_type:complete